jgi:hypothetical protein
MEIGGTPAWAGQGKSRMMTDQAPGGRAGAVGQMAKAAVAEARAAGVDLPGNAQGLAASQIARGADPATVFAALVTPVGDGTDTVESPDAETPAPVDGDPADGVVGEEGAETLDAVTGPAEDGFALAQAAAELAVAETVLEDLLDQGEAVQV